MTLARSSLSEWIRTMDGHRIGWALWSFVVLLQLTQVYLSLEKLSPHELVHLFGVDSSEKVPPTSYSIVSPLKTTLGNGTSIFTVDYLDQRYVFSLTPVHTHDVRLGEKSKSCIYVGRGVSHPGSTLALVDCTGVKRGMIITAEGETLFIHPLTPSARNSSSVDHVVHKREAWNLRPEPIQLQQSMVNATTLLDGESFPAHSRNGSYKNSTRLAVVRGPLTVEIALFADEKLWKHFEKIYGLADAESELHSFILAVVNNINLLYNHRSLEPKVQLKIKRYHVLKNSPALLLDHAHRSGDVDKLLDNFCQYQDSFNPPHDDDPGHWDHALLFTGFDLYRGSLKTVAGYAPVKGMCNGPRSCTINEGLDFGSVFVITHEMGHSLGMFHDGDNGCDLACCIMSPSVGAGKTSWSSCSVQEFNEFLNELGTPSMPSNCLLDGGSEVANVDYSLHGEHPGQRYNADQQCRFYHGSCWRQELREGQTIAEICDMIWCGEGEGVIRTAHPALEGTYCGDDKWCLQGQCRVWPSQNRPPPIDGSWTSWNDAPTDGCQLNCNAPCRVDGQIMIRRSIRLCEDPAPNNGGKACEGAAYRGFICSDAVCRGPQPNEYASDICTGLRDGTGSAGPAIFQLSGRGFQHQEQPCRVWCQLQSGNFARSVGNFPDGTPCGDNRYCIKGSCMKRSCGGLSLVMDDADCPSPDDIAAPAAGAPGGWSQWSFWSACSVTCGRGGRRQRVRSCLGASCKGTGKQEQLCHAQWRCPASIGSASADFSGAQNLPHQNFLDTWLAWSEWGECDVTCGSGFQQRSRKCLTRACAGNGVQSKECQLDDCPEVAGTWTSWESWSPCSGSCGTGTQERRRYCQGNPSCIGENVETQKCQLEECASATSDSGDWGTWSTWAPWSACSRTCGPGGAQYRMRTCSTSRCHGSNVAFSKCTIVECPDSNSVAAAIRSDEVQGRWTQWTNWSGCTRTCGAVGLEQRARVCAGPKDRTRKAKASCQGAAVETRLCASNQCPVG